MQRADLVALASALRAPRVADLPSLTGGLMGSSRTRRRGSWTGTRSRAAMPSGPRSR
jgi:hypothetical protein